MNTLINHTKLFNPYVCIDPSMSYDEMIFLKATKKMVAEKDFTGISSNLGITNSVQEGMELKTILTDTTMDTENMCAIFETDKFIRTENQKGCSMTVNIMPMTHTISFL